MMAIEVARRPTHHHLYREPNQVPILWAVGAIRYFLAGTTELSLLSLHTNRASRVL